MTRSTLITTCLIALMVFTLTVNATEKAPPPSRYSKTKNVEKSGPANVKLVDTRSQMRTEGSRGTEGTDTLKGRLDLERELSRGHVGRDGSSIVSKEELELARANANLPSSSSAIKGDNGNTHSSPHPMDMDNNNNSQDHQSSNTWVGLFVVYAFGFVYLYFMVTNTGSRATDKGDAVKSVPSVDTSSVSKVQIFGYDFNVVFWLSLWFCLNIGLTILNKAIFKFFHFNFPITVSLTHMVVSGILSNYCLIAYPETFPRRRLDSTGNALMIGMSILFSSNIMLGNMSLRYVSVSLVQVVRSLIPGITIAMSYLILDKRHPTAIILTIIPVVAGVAVASYGEMGFHMLGFIITITVCFASSLKTVVSNKFLVGARKLHPIDFLSHMAPLAALQLLAMAYAMGEIDTIYNNWDQYNNFSTLFAVVFSGVMAFGLNIANFNTNRSTSPLTVTVAGNVKHIITILLSIAVFKNPVTWLNGIGTLITVIGAAMYSRANYKEKHAVKMGKKSFASTV